MNGISPSSSAVAMNRVANVQQLKERAAQIQSNLAANSKELSASDQQSVVKLNEQIGVETVNAQNIASAKTAIQDAMARLNNISSILSQMLNLASQSSSNTNDYFSDKMFQSLLRQVSVYAFAPNSKSYNLLSGSSPMYVSVASQGSKNQYVSVSPVNVTQMFSSGLLTILSISSPPQARQTVSKLTASLNSISRGGIALDGSLAMLNKLADGVANRSITEKKALSDLTSLDKTQLSAELFSIDTQLAVYKTIDRLTNLGQKS